MWEIFLRRGGQGRRHGGFGGRASAAARQGGGGQRRAPHISLPRAKVIVSVSPALGLRARDSIGSELCRQIARVGPRHLVLVDHAEDNLFGIVRELEEDRHVRTAIPVLADCKEEERMREVMAEHRPSAISSTPPPISTSR